MIEKILNKIGPTRQVDQKLVISAFEFAKKVHAGQLRAGDEPYIPIP